MNIKDVLIISEAVASDAFFKDFFVRKKDGSIICKTEYGYKRVQFQHYNTYDLVRDDLALEMKPVYGVRFNVLHKWFEKYQVRPLNYVRDEESVAFSGNQFGEREDYYFLENRYEYEKDLRVLRTEVVKNAKFIFSKYSSLQDYYRYIVVETINGRRKFLDIGIEWAMDFLTATKIAAPSDYQRVKEVVLQRIEMLNNRNEPNIIKYYDDLPMILEDLESTDFNSGKWGVIPK